MKSDSYDTVSASETVKAPKVGFISLGCPREGIAPLFLQLNHKGIEFALASTQQAPVAAAQTVPRYLHASQPVP